MRGQKEFVGTLRGYDSHVSTKTRHGAYSLSYLCKVNVVLDDVVEYGPDPDDPTETIRTELKTEILLNGTHVALMVPGSSPEDSRAAKA